MTHFRKLIDNLRTYKFLLRECYALSKRQKLSKIPDFLRYHKRSKLSSLEYINYKFSTATLQFKETFLPYRKSEDYWKILNPVKYSSLARDKFISHCLLERLDIPTPKLLCAYSKEVGNFETENHEHQNVITNDINEVLRLLKEHDIKSFIIKPAADSAHGDGVKKVEIQTLKEFGGDIEIKNLVHGGMSLFEEAVVQNKQMFSFNQSSVNTIRMMTALYPSGDVKLFAAFIKIGRTGSIIDNAGSGGNVDCGVNVETGELYNASKFDSFENVIPIVRHPDSGQKINGTKIEHWNDVVNQVKSYQARIPWLKTIGWDVALTENGPVIIEINNWWDTTGQLFIGKGWHQEIKDCYDAWVEYYNSMK